VLAFTDSLKTNEITPAFISRENDTSAGSVVSKIYERTGSAAPFAIATIALAFVSLIIDDVKVMYVDDGDLASKLRALMAFRS